ncbi:MAG: LTA synthase family protein [Thiohalomonadaceae bacterium]
MTSVFSAAVPTPPRKGWGALVYQWGKDVQLFLFILATLQVFRVVLVGTFHAQVDEWRVAETARVFFTGLRFDLSTAATWVLPTFLLSLSTTVFAVGDGIARVRRGIGYFYACLAMFAFGADLVFFSEYNDQFNQHIFGLFHDDTQAILITIWKDYHPIPVLLGVTAAGWLSLRAVRAWLAHTPSWLASLPRTRGFGRRFAITLALLLFVAAMARGGTLWGEPILLKHAFVADNLFLNRSVINPFTAFAQAVETKVRAELAGGSGTFWAEGDLAGAVRVVRKLHGLPPDPVGANLDDNLRLTARGSAKPPRHVFLILLESHDGWTVLPEYRHFGLSPQLSALAERGVYFRNFLPSASGTIGSMNALITGLPETGLNINYETTAVRPYASAAAETFRRLGYRTRFYYGGYLGWQRLDSFAQAQGFDEVWGGGSMVAEGTPTNEWGVADQYLFDFVRDTVKDDTPSFNFILTTSNHPPYDLDLEALGFPLKELPAPLRSTKSDSLRVLGHLWYTDRELGRFVAEAEQRLSSPLFAITGDHTTRLQIRFPGDGVYEQVGVPFVLYGPEVLDGRQGERRTAGAHIDILPTLYELSAPAGFPYVAFGRDLFTKPSPSYGFGDRFVVGEDFIAPWEQRNVAYAIPGIPRPPATPALSMARREYDALRALGWQRVRRGPTLP